MSVNQSNKSQSVVVELFIVKSYSVALAQNSLGWCNFSTSESSGCFILASSLMLMSFAQPSHFCTWRHINWWLSWRLVSFHHFLGMQLFRVGILCCTFALDMKGKELYSFSRCCEINLPEIFWHLMKATLSCYIII